MTYFICVVKPLLYSLNIIWSLLVTKLHKGGKNVLGNGKGNREKFIHLYFIIRNNPSK
jgi:hypothetical protein